MLDILIKQPAQTLPNIPQSGPTYHGLCAGHRVAGEPRGPGMDRGEPGVRGGRGRWRASRRNEAAVKRRRVRFYSRKPNEC